MADPLTLEQRIVRGRRAATLLADVLMIEAGAAAESTIVSQWQREADPARREVLWCTLQGARCVEWELRQIVDDGAMAKRESELLSNQ